ncbi:MAG: IS110 family transposase [Deltaproteobacteria bacterium]|jgi:transposase|nr:IS110 family transposase [Deltaproteobacteria bacterium]
MKSIFQRANPAILELFEKAGSPEKVLCVPIDYAKREHTALACNGAGHQLRKPFTLHNNPAGVDFLEKAVAGLCRKHAIRREHVFFGGEDGASFTFNFAHALVQKGWLGIGIHARDAARERQNLVASTDQLDLLGIAAVLINKKWGRTLAAECSPARVLRNLVHHRASLVRARSASAQRLHHLADQLLPGFLDEKQSGLTPFTKPSLWVMSRGLAPRRILARRLESLAAGLERFMVRQPAEKARKLKELARAVLPPPAALCDTLQANLDHETSVYAHLDACIHAAEQDIARRLATTPGAMLTTVPGIALTLASALFVEIGDPARDRGLGRLVSYAGLVARLKQSGGPDQEARTHGRSRQACVPLKRCVMDIALKMGQYGHPELKADFERRVNAHQDPRLTLGRRMLRICRHLVRHQDFFLPPSVRAAADPDVRRQYVVRAWDKMLIKWRDAGAIREAFADGAPLEGWRTALNELYGLNLSKTSPYTGRTEIP